MRFRTFPSLLITLLFASGFSLLAIPRVSHAQQALQAHAGSDQNVVVGRKVFFDGSASVVPDTTKAIYSWNFGNGQHAEGTQVNYTYTTAGEYVVRLTITTDSNETASDSIIVFVYDKLLLFVTDKSTTASQIEQLGRLSIKQGQLLFPITDRSNNPDYLREAQITQELLANTDIVKKAQTIIMWTAGNTGLDILSQFSQAANNLAELDMQHKGVFVITDQNLGVISRSAQSAFDLLQPEFIILTQPSAINTIIENGNGSTALVRELQAAKTNYSVIGIHSERAICEAVVDLSVTNKSNLS